MTAPHFRPCEVHAVLAALLRDPWRAAHLEATGQLGAFPDGPPRQVAELLAWNAGDVADCGWGVVFDSGLPTLRVLVARLRGPNAPRATRHAMRGPVAHAVLVSLAVQAAHASPALVEDGGALLEARTRTDLPAARSPGAATVGLALYGDADPALLATPPDAGRSAA